MAKPRMARQFASRNVEAMGLYDWYIPVPARRCPWCDVTLGWQWQGGDGPSRLLVFRQGDRHPIAHDIPAEYALDREQLDTIELPETFEIGTLCPAGHGVDGLGRCEDGVWVELDLSECKQRAAEDAERERVRAVRRSLGY